jgi:hypothetical protein
MTSCSARVEVVKTARVSSRVWKGRLKVVGRTRE